MNQPKALLFDLDGTLVDTAPDMIGALNTLREKRSLPPVPESSARSQVSHGVRGLLKLGFGVTQDDAGYADLAAEYLQTYQTRDHQNTALFPQWTPWLLDIPPQAMGIVTNKPRYLTERLLDVLQLHDRFSALVCGDDFLEKKPHPRPLIEAANRLGCNPTDCCYFGDSERDLVAARRAGQQAILVDWGYFSTTDHPEQWPWHRRVQATEDTRQYCLKWLG